MWSFLYYISCIIVFGTSRTETASYYLTLPIDTQDSNNTQSTYQNTALGQVIPTGFSLIPGSVTGPTLAKHSCLLQILVSLAQTAQQDFEGRQQATSFVHPLLAIELDGRRGGAALERKYAIWGLYRVMSYMLSEDDYHTRLFTLRWQNAIVGRIRVTDKIPPHLSGSNSSMHSTRTSAQDTAIPSLSLPNTTAPSSNSTLGTRFIDGNLEYNINLLGQTFAESDVYMTIATALVEAAPIPAAETIQMFDVDAGAFNSHLRIRDSNKPPRSTPPFLQQSDMVNVLVQIPALMLIENNHWSEANVNIKVDHVAVATGSLRRIGQIAGSASDLLNFEVSTS